MSNFWDNDNIEEIVPILFKTEEGTCCNMVYFYSSYIEIEHSDKDIRCSSPRLTLNEISELKVERARIFPFEPYHTLEIIIDRFRKDLKINQTGKKKCLINNKEYFLVNYPIGCNEYSIDYIDRFSNQRRINEDDRNDMIRELQIVLLFRGMFNYISDFKNSIMIREYKNTRRFDIISFYEGPLKIKSEKTTIKNLKTWFKNTDEYITVTSNLVKRCKKRYTLLSELIEKINIKDVMLFNVFSENCDKCSIKKTLYSS